MPPATAAEPTMKARREKRGMSFMSLPRHLGSRGMDRGANARIGAAAAKGGGHHLVDLFVRWLFDQAEKRNGLHDLAGLAIAALRDLMFDPGLQHRMLLLVGQPFERDDRLACNVCNICLTGADSHSVDLNGAG